MSALDYFRETYRWYKSHGICVACHRNPAENGQIRCAACREKNNACNARYRESRCAAGICYRCGKRPAIHPGKFSLCRECADKLNAYLKRRRAQKEAEEAAE